MSTTPRLKEFSFEEWSKDKSQPVYTRLGDRILYLSLMHHFKEVDHVSHESLCGVSEYDNCIKSWFLSGRYLPEKLTPDLKMSPDLMLVDTTFEALEEENARLRAELAKLKGDSESITVWLHAPIRNRTIG